MPAHHPFHELQADARLHQGPQQRGLGGGCVRAPALTARQRHLCASLPCPRHRQWRRVLRPASNRDGLPLRRDPQPGLLLRPGTEPAEGRL